MEQINLNAEHLITLDKFKPRDYQLPIWDAIENKGYRKVLYVAPRRSGKDISAWNFSIRQCIKKTCLIYYCLPTYKHIRKVIFDAIANDGTPWLSFIPKQLISTVNKSDMQIRFINGSILQCVGVKNYNTSLIGTNAFGIVLSEFAIMESADVFNYIRPIIAANGGWCLIVSCVAPNTFVIHKDGLRRIKNISSSREEYSDLNEMMYGLKGFHNAEQFYYGGKQKTLKITLETGHTIECTHVHPLWDGKQWIKSAELRVGKKLPIQYEQNIWPENGGMIPYIDEEVFYFLGAISMSGDQGLAQKYQEHIDSKHMDLVAFYGLEFNVIIREVQSYLGLTTGNTNRIPDQLLMISKDQMIAFIKGIFDIYATTWIPCKETNGAIYLSCNYEQFLLDLQVVFTNLGYITYVEKHEGSFRMILKGCWAEKYYNEIGFEIEEKRSAQIDLGSKIKRGNMSLYDVDCDKLSDYKVPTPIAIKSEMTRFELECLYKRRKHWYLEELLSEKFYYSPIISIEESENEVFDFVIPETNSFFSNGFISHNTPRGKNHMWHLHKMVEKLPDWYVLVQKTSQIKHIPYDILMEEKAQMDPCLYAQEFEVSYERGVIGSYFGAAIDRIKLNDQICHVPHEPQLLVYTTWDIGVNDDTTIVFWQQSSDGLLIRVIDCYSNNNLGMDHYAHIIKERGQIYNYGVHYAPHDVMVREFGNRAMTRLSAARELGLNFEKLPQVGLVDSIQAALLTIPKVWFDEKKCKPLLDSIENYKRQWDEVHQMYLPTPAKSRWNHFADAFRYMCQAIPMTRTYLSGEDYDKIRNKYLMRQDHLPYSDPYRR